MNFFNTCDKYILKTITKTITKKIFFTEENFYLLKQNKIKWVIVFLACRIFFCVHKEIIFTFILKWVINKTTLVS